MYAARQDGVEVSEQLDVVVVVTTDVVERVGKVLPACKMLLKRREAATERMTPSVNDLGVRQDQMDHADVQKIIRHLVDKERRWGSALNARLVKVALTQLRQFLIRHVLQAGRIPGPFAAARPPGQFTRKRRDIRQFHRAFHLGVARENLLNQR